MRYLPSSKYSVCRIASGVYWLFVCSQAKLLANCYFLPCAHKVTQIKEQEYSCKLSTPTNYSPLREYSPLGE